MKNLIQKTAFAAVVMGAFGFTAGSTAVADEAVPGLQNRTIGYVLTHRKWAVYTTPGAKQECPHGINEGEREQFKRLGVLGDWDHPYLTLDRAYEADELRLLADIVEIGPGESRKLYRDRAEERMVSALEHRRRTSRRHHDASAPA